MLDYAVLGMTDDAIARKLEVSRTTVLTYWGRIRSKLGFSNRVQLTAAAVRIRAEERIRELEEQLEAATDTVAELQKKLREGG